MNLMNPNNSSGDTRRGTLNREYNFNRAHDPPPHLGLSSLPLQPLEEENQKFWLFRMALDFYVVKKSIHSLKQGHEKVKTVGNAVAYEAIQLSKVMSSSKGRDKICAIT